MWNVIASLAFVHAVDRKKKKKKCVNLIYSGHALSCTALSSASSQACHLNK